MSSDADGDPLTVVDLADAEEADDPARAGLTVTLLTGEAWHATWSPIASPTATRSRNDGHGDRGRDIR